MSTGAGARVKAALCELLFRCGAAALVRALNNRRRGNPVCILSAHRVADPAEPLSERDAADLARGCLSLPEFAQRIGWLRRRFHFASLEAYGRALAGGGTMGPNTVILTFDDGFRDVYRRAYPRLLADGIPFAVFLTTGWVGRDPLMLSEGDVREMARNGRGLITWGAHGVTHTALTALAPAEAEEEIVRSKRQVEEWTGAPVGFFSYPDGRYDERIRAMLVKHEFSAACATGRALNWGAVDRFALKRIPCESERLSRFAFRVAGRV